MSKKRVSKKATKKVTKKTTKKVVKKAAPKKTVKKKKVVKKPITDPDNDQRVKYVKEVHDEQVYKLCLLGAIDTEIADFFEIAVSTLNYWKKRNKSFAECLKAGKTMADANVAERLYARAMGTTIPDDVVLSHKGQHTDTVKRLKHLPPDVVAQIFWLKNRKNTQWRDRHEVEPKGDLADAFVKLMESSPD